MSDLRYDSDKTVQNDVNRSAEIIRKVEQLSKADVVHPKDDLNDSPKKRFQKRQQKEMDEVADHFKQLTDLVEKAHQVLVRKKSPYRFCVYHKGEDVFIDIVLVDEAGKINQIKHKDITHDDFLMWIRHIESGEGMFFDYEA